ncbi:MAG: tRNA (adenosine(37)-N6)-dimethylallyltransferase MiaA [Myxococcales bacterium]|nr:tRNA (adenosine(37)-N6)-dimethylallyltransferase MiaA [Myxococcales bacterium]MCB9667872.1 tRNA (adenosine(37)-N6)-dimethylallyltransferase MiaA [Alphaproteobacteria bacterium]MCB9690526.1 tRNA (adenosine(37)-N6)-dimethylallyltransferase MiaA [Alphaproteobacteria bacterium]
MKALVLGGPTASGKTGLAVELALQHGAVVVSADAMQVYRGMDIGTGKATLEERRGVPHFGFDLRDPDEPFDAADFVALAEQVMAGHERVIVAGGTSLYLQALRRGLVATPDPDPALRAELEATPDLHARLQAVDPVLATRLHPNDRVRLVRGIEVHALSGQRLSELHDAHAAAPDRVEVHGVWLDREDLDARIDARVLQMMADGYLDEVRGLLAAGYPSTLKPMRSLGYRHLCEHVETGLPLDEAVRRTQRDTRRFARKQRTWRRHVGLGEDVGAAVRAMGW